jgi:hypothetical protein
MPMRKIIMQAHLHSELFIDTLFINKMKHKFNLFRIIQLFISSSFEENDKLKIHIKLEKKHKIIFEINFLRTSNLKIISFFQFFWGFILLNYANT